MGIVRRRRVLRAAAVGGVAYAAGRHQGRQAAEDEYYEPEPAPPEPIAAAPDAIAQLEQLAELKKQGILTDEEFAEQKARILNG